MTLHARRARAVHSATAHCTNNRQDKTPPHLEEQPVGTLANRWGLNRWRSHHPLPAQGSHQHPEGHGVQATPACHPGVGEKGCCGGNESHLRHRLGTRRRSHRHCAHAPRTWSPLPGHTVPVVARPHKLRRTWTGAEMGGPQSLLSGQWSPNSHLPLLGVL